MQRDWSADELGMRWSLRPEDIALPAGMMDVGKLGFASQLGIGALSGHRYTVAAPGSQPCPFRSGM